MYSAVLHCTHTPTSDSFILLRFAFLKTLSQQLSKLYLRHKNCCFCYTKDIKRIVHTACMGTLTLPSSTNTLIQELTLNQNSAFTHACWSSWEIEASCTIMFIALQCMWIIHCMIGKRTQCLICNFWGKNTTYSSCLLYSWN